MASSFELPFLLFLFSHAILFRSKLVRCDGFEDILLEGINNNRQSLNLHALVENENAKCLAEQIVNQMDEDQLCNTTTTDTTSPITIAKAGSSSSSSHPQLFTDFPRLLKECYIDTNTARDGVILPLCTIKIIFTGLVCTNCTKSQYSKYLSSSNYTGVGINSGENWMAIVLSTNTTTGSIVSAADLVSNVGLMSHCFFFLLLLELFLGN